MKSKSDIKKAFKNGEKPKQEDFWEWQDSYWHKEDPQDIIPANRVDLSAKADLINGKVPAEQLPGFVDDILEFETLETFPTEGEAGKLFLAKNTNKLYRWSGSQYVDVTSAGTNPSTNVNISTADLTNTQARTFTQNASFTWNTLGNPYYWKGLIDRTNNNSFDKVLKLNSATKELGIGDSLEISVTVPDVITSNNNLSVAPLTVNHIYPNPTPNITTYVQNLQNIMATIGNLNFIKMNNWVVNSNNPTNSSQLVTGNGLITFNLGASQTAAQNTPVVSVASPANLFPVNKNFVIFFNIPKSWDAHQYGQTLVGLSQSDDNSSIISPTVAFADSYGAGNVGWSSGSVTNPLSPTHVGSIFIVKSGQVVFIIICNNTTGTKVVASFDANVNGGDYRFVATMIQKPYGSAQQIPITEIKYWIEP